MIDIAHNAALLFLLFVVGMVAQAFIMLAGRWEKGDTKKVLIAFALGLIGMVPGKHETNYDLPLHLFFTCVLAAFFFVHQFREKLLVRLNGQLLLIWNILFIAVALRHVPASLPILLVIGIPTSLTLLNGFVNLDERFRWQVFFHTWFSIMIVGIGLSQFNFAMIHIFDGQVTALGMSPFAVLVTGASFLYLLANLWYVIAIIPIPYRRSQTFAERMQEVRDLIHLIALGYIWKKDNAPANLALVLGLSLAFYINYMYGLVGEQTLIATTMVLSSYAMQWKRPADDMKNAIANTNETIPPHVTTFDGSLAAAREKINADS